MDHGRERGETDKDAGLSDRKSSTRGLCRHDFLQWHEGKEIGIYILEMTFVVVSFICLASVGERISTGEEFLVLESEKRQQDGESACSMVVSRDWKTVKCRSESVVLQVRSRMMCI
jgi:hypothetical protein